MTPPSVALARSVVLTAIRAGVTDAVLSPGSRDAPLSLALADADAAGLLRLHVRIDERSAGFLALGLGRATGRPAIVVTTSGTAVANLHPAVLEAHHGGVPLLVLSADRPAALRALGANQVIDQHRVFGGALRDFAELTAGGDPGEQVGRVRAALAATTAAPLPGPVQLNLALDVPLLPDDTAVDPRSGDGWLAAVGAGTPWRTAAPDAADVIAAPEPGERVLFVADLTHPAAAGVAASGHPLMAEAGGAAGAGVLAAGIPLLEAGLAASAVPDRVVVLGRPTLYRAVTALLAQAPVVDVVGPTGPVADPTGRARRVAGGLAPVAPPTDPAWRDRWRAADRVAQQVIAAVLADRDLGVGPVLARELVAALPATSTLLLGSSQGPRDVGRFSAARDGVRVLANRGVAGIDGTVSTAVGAALGDPGRPTIGLLGDLTALHEIGGLLIGPHEPRPDVTLVVANNDGGAIFATLEPGAPAHARHFERVFATPTGAPLGALVEAYGAEHLLVTDAAELRAELRADVVLGGGLRVIEVPVERTGLRALLAGTTERVRAALGL